MPRYLVSIACSAIFLPILFSCGSKSTAINGSTVSSMSDVNHMEKRSDGKFLVVCNDGKTEIRTESEISANQVCTNSSHTPVIDKCDWGYSSHPDILRACFHANSVEIVDKCDWEYSSHPEELKQCFNANSVAIIDKCDWKYSSHTEELHACFYASSVEVIDSCDWKYSNSNELQACLRNGNY